MYLYSIPETTLIIYGISIVIPLMMQTIKMAESMESEKTTVTSMPPYLDIFSEDFKITDEIKYEVLKKPWTTIHSYDFHVRYKCRSSLTYKVLVRDSSVVRRHYIFLLEPWDVRELCIRKTADLPLRLLVGSFPRFVAIRFYFLSETLI
jgi:hypothetical protein